MLDVGKALLDMLGFFVTLITAILLVALMALIAGSLCIDIARELKERKKKSDSKRTMSETPNDSTCYNSSVSPDGFLCSKCGWGDFCEPNNALMIAKYANDGNGPNFCPNCGRRVAGRDYEA